MTTATLLESMRSPEGVATALREHAPRIVTVLLAVAVAAQAAILLTNYFGAADHTPTMRPANPGAAPPTRSLDLAGLLNAHIFGRSAQDAAASGSNAPQTALALVLTGVLAQSDAEKGLALVGETAATAKVHAVGDMLPGGAKLHGVYLDRVVLDRGGTLESLMLPRQAAPAGLSMSQQAPPLAGSTGDRVRQLVQQDPNALASLLRWQQVFNREGRMSGVRVYPERNPASFAKLGLRPGDLITSINGTPLDDASRGDEILRSLGSMPEAKVSVVRNGRTTDLMLNLTQALNEAEPLVGASSMPSIEQQSQMPAPQQGPQSQ